DNVPDYTGPNPDYSYSNTGEFNITLDIWTQGGCFASFTNSQSITVETQVDTEIFATDTIICAGDVAQFCVTEQPGVSYSWNYGDGAGWDNYQSWEICATHDYQDTGYFDITLSVFNEGCSHLITYEDYIFVNGPIALFEYTTNCADVFTVNFQDNSIIPQTLTWDFGDGSPVVVDESAPSHTFPGPGSYVVTLTAYNSITDCEDVTTQTVTIIPPEPTVIVNNPSGCAPLEVSFLNTNDYPYWNVDFGNGDWMEVIWNVNHYDVTGTIEGEFYDEDYGSNQNFWPAMIYNALGTFDIVVYIEDDNGCANSVTYNDAVDVISSPDFAEFNIDIIEGCSEVFIGFDPIANNLDTWEWTFSDGTIVSDLQPNHVFDPPYDYDLFATFTAVNDLGCNSTVTQDIPLVPPAEP
ncbi:MAG: PKD domain-containing protein, partial [Flavobacteriales bacterium]|nr:PKD domain-containing protein [Flavobacteriales bacterium]